MCEKKLISRDNLKEFVKTTEEFRDEMVEDYYEKNPNEIDLYDVIEVIENAHSYGQGFINIKTGEKEYIPEEESLYPGDLDELYDKIDGPNWVEVPSVDDYEIMTNFASTLTNQKQVEKLIDILHHKKAYRNFKDAIHEMNIEDKYYDFYDSQIEALAKIWLEENRDDIDLDPDYDFGPEKAMYN